ncbi:MAG: hypothetical protein ACRDQ5_22955, partial [Sciscionella sp.]
RDSSRPPSAPAHPATRRPPTNARIARSSTAARVRPASESSRRSRRPPPIPAGADAVCDGLTVSFAIRYVDGPEGDRFAAAQAGAISALLDWLAHRTDTSDMNEERRAA